MTAKQIPLELQHVPSFELADFIVSRANEDAVGLLEGYRDWPSHAVALVGPEASGKSHLVKGWAADNNGIIFSADMEVSSLSSGDIVICEDADRADYSDEQLFHLFNWVKEIGGKLIFTARAHPSQWDVSLPDLRSRLAIAVVGEIYEPDDELLMVLLIKMFSDRQLQVDLGVIHYILPRIERSFYSIHRFVDRLDKASLTDKKKITKALAKTCLQIND